VTAAYIIRMEYLITGSRRAALFISGGFFFLCALAFSLFTLPNIVYNIFCVPAAWLANLYIGGDLISAGGIGAHIIKGHSNIFVSKACSGMTFFLITCAVVFHSVIEGFPKGRRIIPWLLPGAYVMTILINSFRVVVSWKVRAFIPEDFFIPYPTVHLAVGVMIFLTALISARFLILFMTKKMEEKNDAQVS